MSDLTDSDITKPTLGKLKSSETILFKTVRLTSNLITNMLMCLTVFISLLYAFGAKKVTVFQLHIILCVLGYQLFMCQGVLVISKYNSWSMYLSRQSKHRVHIWFQSIGFVLAVAGSIVIMKGEKQHFNSTHGVLGVVSLIFSTISIANGGIASYAYKISRSYVFVIKVIHYTSGILTLLLSASALTTGFQEFPFRNWVKDEHAITGLIFITWVFILLVALDFLLLTGQRQYNLIL